MENTVPNQQFQSLLNDGPQTTKELPGTGGPFDIEVRQDGVRKFDPKRSATRGYAGSIGGPRQPVYFIHGKHSPESVIQKWLSVNDMLREEVPHRPVYHMVKDYGAEWKDAARELLDLDFNTNPDGETGYETGGTCPMCGDEYVRELPDHLPCDSTEAH